MASIQDAVEDELGNVERLAIYNVLPNVEPNEVLPPGAILAIKKPYHKRTGDGGLIVRIDRPSDFIRLKPGNPFIPARLSSKASQAEMSPFELKKRGNEAFGRENWQQAVD